MKLSGSLNIDDFTKALMKASSSLNVNNSQLDKNTVSTEKNAAAHQKATSATNSHAKAIDNVSNTLSGNTSAHKKNVDVKNQDIDVSDKLILKTTEYNNGTKTVTKYLMEENAQMLKTLTITKQQVDGIQQVSTKMDTALKSTTGLNSAIEGQNVLFKKSQYSFAKAFESFSTYLSVTTVFYTMINGIKDMIGEVTNLDSKLLELRKVTDLSGDSLKEYTQKAYEVGETVAHTGSEVIEASTEFAKSGYTAEESMQLGKVALMYSNVADEEISAGDSASFIIAQLKAFNLQASDSMHIIDAVNQVSNDYAVSSADLAENIGTASAALASSNTTYEQSLGMLTAITEQTRNASKAANSLKTLSARLRGLDDEGNQVADLVPKLESEFSSLTGKTLTDANGQIRSTYDIAKDLAEVWPTLTENQKTYFGELAAGKFQLNNFLALMNNFDTAISATEDAMNSTGSATKENEKYLDSIQGKLEQLKSQWEEFSTNLVDSELIKFVIDLGTAFLKLANTGVGTFVIKMAAVGLLLSGTTALYRALSQSVIKYAAAQALSNGAIEGASDELKKLNAEQIIQLATTNQDIAANLKDAMSLQTIGGALKGSIAGGLAGLKTFFSSVGGKITIVIGAITLLYEAYKWLNKNVVHSQEKLTEAYTESAEALKDSQNELEENSKKIKELESKKSLTFVEQAELDKLKLANSELDETIKKKKEIAEEDLKKVKREATKEAKQTLGTYSVSGSVNSSGTLPSGQVDLSVGNPTKPGEGVDTSQVRNLTDDLELVTKLNIAKKNGEITDEQYTEQEKELSNVYSDLNTNAQKYLDVSKNEFVSAKVKKEAYQKYLDILSQTNEAEYKSTVWSDLLKENSNLSAAFSDLSITGDLTTESIENLKEEFPGLAEFMDEVEISDDDLIANFNKTSSAADQTSSVISSLGTELSSIGDKYDILTNAVDDFNSTGSISADTFQKLVSNDLLQYLSLTSAGLQANTTELENEAAALKISALASLQKSYATDAMAIANNNAENASAGAQAIIEGENKALSNTASLAKAAAGGLFTFATAQSAIGGNSSVISQKKKQFAELNSLYNGMAASISKINIGSSSSKSSSGSSSSSSTKEWWETQLESLKKQFSDSEITIDTYISSLEHLLGQVQKGSDAWREINKELRDSKLSKIEDDYKRGTITVQQYISFLKDLANTAVKGSKEWLSLVDKIKDAQKTLLTDAKTLYAKKEANKASEKEIKLAELQAALYNAQNEKTKRVWREGLGWQWEADQSAIDEAQKNLSDYIKDDEISQLEDKRDKEVEILQNQIDALNKYKDTWANVTADYDLEQDKLLLSEQLGASSEGDILNQRLGVLEAFKAKYIQTLKDLEAVQNSISSTYSGGIAESPVITAATSSSSKSSSGSSSKSYSGTSSSGGTIKTVAKANTYNTGKITPTATSKKTCATKKTSTTEANKASNALLNSARNKFGYAEGGIVDYTGYAKLHGNPDHPEIVLNNREAKNLYSMLKLPSPISGKLGSNSNSYVYNFDNLILPNVTNAKQFITELKSKLNTTNNQ